MPGQPAAPAGELPPPDARRDSRRALPDGEIRILDGQLRQRARLAGEKRRDRALRSRCTSTPIDQPSLTMWCIVEQRAACSSRRSGARRRAAEGPFRGRTAARLSSAASRRISASAARPAGRRGRPRAAAARSEARSPAPARRPRWRRSVVRRASWRRHDPPSARARARQVESPEDARRRRQVVDRIAGIQTVEEPEPELAERKGSGASRSSRGSMRSVAPSAGLFLRRRSKRTVLLGGRKSGELVLRLSHRSSISPRELLPLWGNRDDRRSGRARAPASGAREPWFRRSVDEDLGDFVADQMRARNPRPPISYRYTRRGPDGPLKLSGRVSLDEGSRDGPGHRARHRREHAPEPRAAGDEDDRPQPVPGVSPRRRLRPPADAVRRARGGGQGAARRASWRGSTAARRRRSPASCARRRTSRQPAPKYVSAEGKWTVRFQEDPNGTLSPGDVEVVSEFARPPEAGYGAGSKTHRISTTRGSAR